MSTATERARPSEVDPRASRSGKTSPPSVPTTPFLPGTEFRADPDEHAVIGALLIDPSLVTEARRRLVVDDFFLPACRVAFQVMVDCDEAGEVATFTRILARLGTSKEVQYPASTLLDWVQECATTVHLRWYALAVARAAQRRRLFQASAEVAQASGRSSLDADEAVKRAAEIVAAVPRAQTSVAETLDGAGLAALLAERFGESRPEETVIPTGLIDLDRQLSGGLRPGQLCLVAGRPGMGKSALLRKIARAMALRGPVLFASNEMPGLDLGIRDLAALTGIPIPTLTDPRWTTTPEHQERIQVALSNIAFLPLHLYAEGAMTSAGLRSYAASLHAREGLVGIVVDYLQRMSDPGRTSLDRVGYTARALKSLAMTLNLPVVAGSQLSRTSERESADRRPTLIDLRDSGELEQESDVVLLLYRASYHYPSEADWQKAHKKEAYPGNKAEIWIGKQRQGVSGVCVEVVWRPPTATFADLARTEEAPF